MQKRASERLWTRMDLRLFHGHAFYSGKVLNLSEKGILISSTKRISVGSTFVGIIRIESNNILLVPRVKWVEETEGSFNSMGAVILYPPKDYLRFIENIRPNKKSTNLKVD